MPISYIDVPQGIRIEAKKRLVQEVYAALDEAYRIPDTRIFLREWPLESVSQDGKLDSQPVRPICSLEVPRGLRTEVRRQVVKRICAAITEAYRVKDVVVFFREYPLDAVGQDGGLQSENPTILEAMKKAGIDPSR